MEKSKSIIRVWQEMDVKLIEPHLLMAGQVSADCSNCKEVGIPFEAKACPKCGTLFKYMGTRVSNSTKEAKRLHRKRPDLTLVEFSDVKEVQARDRARGFLGG